MINVSDNDSVTFQAQLKLWWVQSRVAAPKEVCLHGGVETGGSGGLMNRGPRAAGAPSGVTKNLGKKIIITERAVLIYLILILTKFIKIVAMGVARWCRCTPKATLKIF